MDLLTVELRSKNMSRIPSKDTSIEIKVIRYLFSNGYRFRKNVRELPGKPDIVLPKYNTVIFIHGCFWHRHKGCKDATTPKSNVAFWNNKFDANVRNDERHKEALTQIGWNVIEIWQCEIEKRFDETMISVIESLNEGLTRKNNTKIKREKTQNDNEALK